MALNILYRKGKYNKIRRTSQFDRWFFFGNNAIPAAILDFETTKAESEIVSMKRFVVYRESIRASP